MGEDRQIDELKKECYVLYEFKDDRSRYEQAVNKLEQRITELGLKRAVDPIELSFLLLFQTYPFPANPEEFKRYVDKFFKVKKTSFYFQLPQLVGFPDKYLLGHGQLRNFDSLTSVIKNFAAGLTEGKVGKVRTEQERIQTVLLREMSIPTNPKAGCWLEISKCGIGNFIILEKALQEAEESLDILRILRPHVRIVLPPYVISKKSDEEKASFDALKIESYPYHFDQQEQKLIGRLNKLVAGPRSDLEQRVINALRFYRIGRDFTEDQELFYYVAAIENLVIGKDDRAVLRWKFSEKAAFLLEDDLTGRLDMVDKLKSLYDARSTIAHGNISHASASKAPLARDYLIKIIKRMLELIDERGLKSMSSTAKEDSLDEYIDKIKYSGKSKSSKKYEET